MKTTVNFIFGKRISPLVFIISLLCFSFAIQSDISDIQGIWTAEQNINLRIKKDYKTYVYKHLEILELEILSTGEVKGKIGAALLEDCNIVKHKSGFFRDPNVTSEFLIKGKLIGKINNMDSKEERSIKIPINYSNNVLSGSLFDLQSGVNNYMVSSFVLHKK